MTCDLDQFAKTALSKKELAWESLKETRNPEYVSLRFGYPVEDLRKALEKIPDAEPLNKRLAGLERKHYAKRANTALKRASDVLPDYQRTEERGPPPPREPGCDDEDDWY